MLRVTEIWSSSCVPEPEIKWDQCVNRDESLAGTPDSTIDNTGNFIGGRDLSRDDCIEEFIKRI